MEARYILISKDKMIYAAQKDPLSFICEISHLLQHRKHLSNKYENTAGLSGDERKIIEDSVDKINSMIIQILTGQ